MEKLSRKPHAVCVPVPAQSHINAMLKFAKLLHHKGFFITFVHAEYIYNRILKSGGPNASSDGLLNFRFVTIPDGIPPAENDDFSQDVFRVYISMAKNGHAPFVQLLKNLNDKASVEDDDYPPVSCVISDSFMGFTLEASEELGIPNAQLWTVNATSAMCFIHYPQFIERGYAPIKDESWLKHGYLDQTVDWIPGISNIRLRDISPTLWTTDPNDEFLECVIDSLPGTFKGSALIINTFDSIEYDVLRQYSSMVNHLYTVGPIHLLLKQIQNDEIESEATCAETIQSSFWKEDSSSIEWLDSMDKGSVVYVNFGSLTLITKDQFIEFAWGLANSMHNFLWIIRPDLVLEGALFPPEFVEATKGRGMISTWCDQELVLNHASIGTFLTHCGWNSILESLSAGVPLICLPFVGDQQTNCLCCCSYWGVGVEIDRNVDRVEVEKVVRDTMEGKMGEEIKKKTLEWKSKAEEAIKPFIGSSYLNLDKLIQDVLLKPK